MQKQKQLVKVGDIIICKKTTYYNEIKHPELYEKWNHPYWRRLYQRLFTEPLFKDGEKYEVYDVKHEYTGPFLWGVNISQQEYNDKYLLEYHLYYIKETKIFYGKYKINDYVYERFANFHIEKIFHTPTELRKNKLKKLNNETIY